MCLCVCVFFLFFQFCDVTDMVIIHKPIDKIWNKINNKQPYLFLATLLE
jgi:hypothetical protein